MIHSNRCHLDEFADRLRGDDVLEQLRAGLIGEGTTFESPFGKQNLVYADYVASGRALRQIEEFILEKVLPFYANSHSEASHCGNYITQMRKRARSIVAEQCGADGDYATVFCGAGATAGINKLVYLLGVSDEVARGNNPLVIIGPYEHHSNILPWRECGAEVLEISESADGGPDLSQLENVLKLANDRMVVGAFSATSNVTGIVTDVDRVSELLNRYGAISVWDYAGGAPYLKIDMKAGTRFSKDAVVLSPHKFIGGPGASGIMIVRKSLVIRSCPVTPGGGTVLFVSPEAHDYSEEIETREEAGTPNVIGDIRAALCFLVKDVIGQTFLDRRHKELRERALAVWSENPNIEILGKSAANQHLPIFSIRVRNHKTGETFHHQKFTRTLSDRFGIQARGGCACAGPYAHRLLNIDDEQSELIRADILAGDERLKPGWTRLNLSVLMDDAKADYVIRSVDSLAYGGPGISEAQPSEFQLNKLCDPVV
ncbi:MAG: aminotransferase class V-fold PLP-dependent enzyme [Pseudomonadota bacterium]